MRVLLVSCLLIGSIVCGPVARGYGASNVGMQQPYSFGHLSSGRGEGSDFGSSSLESQNGPYGASLNSYGGTNMADSKAFDSGYVSPDVYGGYSAGYGGEGYVVAPQDENWNSGYGMGMVFDSGYTLSGPGVSDHRAAYAGSQGTGTSDGLYGSVSGSYEGDGSYGYVAAVRDENWNSESVPGYGGENPEPVFSDVSDLEPVYSFSSRSRYQHGSAVFAQTRYTPGEPFFPPMPVARRTSKTTFKENRPDVPAKGGF